MIAAKSGEWMTSAGTGECLILSHLFFGASGSDASNLYLAIQDLGLQVQQIVGGHGGVSPFTTLAVAYGEGGGI
jgi:hypothetical protein